METWNIAVEQLTFAKGIDTRIDIAQICRNLGSTFVP